MEQKMPTVASIVEEEELIPGGDIRIKGNAWVRDAYSKSRAKRVPRESEFRKIVALLVKKYNLCSLDQIMLAWCFCFSIRIRFMLYIYAILYLGPKGCANQAEWVLEQDSWLFKLICFFKIYYDLCNVNSSLGGTMPLCGSKTSEDDLQGLFFIICYLHISWCDSWHLGYIHKAIHNILICTIWGTWTRWKPNHLISTFWMRKLWNFDDLFSLYQSLNNSKFWGQLVVRCLTRMTRFQVLYYINTLNTYD